MLVQLGSFSLAWPFLGHLDFCLPKFVLPFVLVYRSQLLLFLLD